MGASKFFYQSSDIFFFLGWGCSSAHSSEAIFFLGVGRLPCSEAVYLLRTISLASIVSHLCATVMV